VEEAERLADQLKGRGIRVVFAESCTGGLVSALMAQIPGISDFLCGSAVTYRNDTKARWLGVPEDMLLDPGPVSAAVARAMAEAVLRQTPEAAVAASVTGHLGPNAPAEQDGLIWIGVAQRAGPGGQITTATLSHRLPKSESRHQRQQSAARHVLRDTAEVLESR